MNEEKKEQKSSDAPPLGDEELIALILRGDKTAYSDLIQRYLKKIWRLSISILGSEHEAEDVVQEVFLTLWQSLEKWDSQGKAKFSTWIYRVAFNKCIDVKRKRKPSTSSDEMDIKSEEQNAYHFTLEGQLSEKLSALLKTLPDTQRESLFLYYYEELTVPEISVRMEKSEQSIRSLLKRGKAALKDRMQDDQNFQSFDMTGVADYLRL